jgi:hypothetical protein
LGDHEAVAFQRELPSFVTRDPETGWELREKSNRDYTEFTLRREGESFTFQTGIIASRELSQLSEHGRPLVHWTVKVTSIDHKVRPPAEEQKRVIDAALQAHWIYPKSGIAILDVLFVVNSHDSFLIVLMDCADTARIADVAQSHLDSGRLPAHAANPARTFLADMVARRGLDPSTFASESWGFKSGFPFDAQARNPGRNTHDHKVSSWACRQNAIDGKAFVSTLSYFWRDLIRLDAPRRPRLDLPHRLFPRFEDRTKAVKGPSEDDPINDFDHILIALETRKPARRVEAWTVQPGFVGPKIDHFPKLPWTHHVSYED